VVPFAGVSVKYRDEITKAHLNSELDCPLGFNHRLYCKIPTDAEKKKQQSFCEEGGPDKIQGTDDMTMQNEDQVIVSKQNEDSTISVVESEEEIKWESEYEDESEYETESDEGIESEESKESEKENENLASEIKFEGEPILQDLTPCDVRVLVHSEEELTQCETFERIFPTASTGHYLAYTSTNYYDLLLLAWEKRYAGCRQDGRDRIAQLTAKGVHLDVPESERRVPHPPPQTPTQGKKNFEMPHIYRR